MRRWWFIEAEAEVEVVAVVFFSFVVVTVAFAFAVLFMPEEEAFLDTLDEALALAFAVPCRLRPLTSPPAVA
jgi:uncharacterized PurR-regulated membrane protein YhhQ (DUF165 family)